MNKTLKSILVGSIAVFGLSLNALANSQILLPGTSTIGNFDSVPPNVWGTGTVLASTTNSYASTTLAGTIYSWVESGVASNPFGGLTFFYTIENSGFYGSAGVEKITVDGFTGFSVAVAQDNYYAGYSVAPNSYGSGTAASTASLTPDGNVVGFNYVFMPVGSASWDLIVYTDAISYKLVNSGVIDGTTANNMVLGANVPDGGTTALMFGLGLLGLGLAARRNKRA